MMKKNHTNKAFKQHHSLSFSKVLQCVVACVMLLALMLGFPAKGISADASTLSVVKSTTDVDVVKLMNQAKRYLPSIQQSLHLNPLANTPAAPKAAHACVFISLGLPKPLLEMIFDEAASYQLPVAIRGLYHNSFRETLNRLFDYSKRPHFAGIMIAPNWFRRFHIDRVPALVVSQKPMNDTAIQSGDFDAVFGNARINDQLQFMVAQDDHVSPLARKIMQRARTGA